MLVLSKSSQYWNAKMVWNCLILIQYLRLTVYLIPKSTCMTLGNDQQSDTVLSFTWPSHKVLNQGFSTGSRQAKSSPLTILGWPFVNFEMHRNTQGNGVHLALAHVSLNRLWPFLACHKTQLRTPVLNIHVLHWVLGYKNSGLADLNYDLQLWTFQAVLVRFHLGVDNFEVP